MKRADFKTQAYEIFGEKAFAFGLYYQHTYALRLELAGAGSFLDRFLQALHRAETVCEDVFAGVDDLYVCLSSYQYQSMTEWARPLLASLRQCGIQVPRARQTWRQPDEGFPDQGGQRAFLSFRFEKSDLRKFLWGSAAKDFGYIAPSLHAHAYIYSPTKRFLVLPYDDRGTDIIGCDRVSIEPLYRKYNAWLLDYDRERMDAVFAER